MMIAMAFSFVAVGPPFDLDKLKEVILPDGKEQAWMQIPWMTDLWQARQRASEQGKPIFLWEMDGHPLGCT